ncbi:hypothetical protein [Patulibacter sp. SYSU D01012]|uniref:hypothetical protein n=1 Tax=Patulibacter sp. SYSU D01012 TaxID=2817381 RepID=UPI001B301EC0|nr:hypothetical protein [Patulibacter sp. SYSU D01012]
MLVPLAQAANAGDGAPIGQIAIVAVATTLVTVLVLGLIALYRRGGARPLRALADAAERGLGLPGWAAVPAFAGIAFGACALFGVTWDVALHLDQGRDEGPLGTLAHYPILVGLLGLFQSGLLAVGMAPARRAESSRVALRIRGLWPVPLSAALMLVASSMAFLGFPLDDGWHRMFGQDVTLWGPTHVMMIACAVLGVIAAILLLVEGARVAGRDLHHPAGVAMRPIPVLFGGVTLLGWAIMVGEFDWGVPQYRMVWHPLLLAFAAAQGLTMARIWGGRGAALAAWAMYFPLLGILSLLVGGPLGQSMPALPLFLVHAVVVELLALRGVRRPLAFGAVAGLACGTIGFAAEYAWSHLVLPLPWTPALLPEGLPTSIVAGVAGGVLGAVFVGALTNTLAPGRAPRIAAWAAAVAVVLTGANALAARAPEGVSARIQVADVHRAEQPGRAGVGEVGQVRVRFDPPSVTDGAHWVQITGWQGGGLFVDRLRKAADGTWASTKPVPLDGNWKSLVRVHEGRTMLSAPIVMPRDAAIGFGGYPVRSDVVRPMVFDHELLQIERKPDIPAWLWTPAILAVLGLVALLMYGCGRVAGRIGRGSAASPVATVGPGWVGRTAGDALRRLGGGGRRPPTVRPS